MPKVTIHLAPHEVMRNAFYKPAGNMLAIVRENFGSYTNAGSFETELTGEEAVEEAFDLTNNPGRQEEREEKYGRGRSVSSGDVVDVDGVKYACLSIGWAQL